MKWNCQYEQTAVLLLVVVDEDKKLFEIEIHLLRFRPKIKHCLKFEIDIKSF
jgi:hypothetical protein